MRMFKFIIAVFLLFNVQIVSATYNFTSDQLRIMHLAYELGEEHNLGKAMVGIALRETQAGKFGPVGDLDNHPKDRSYGVFQIKVDTAKHVVRMNPHLDRGLDGHNEWRVELIGDDVWNARIALHYLKWLRYDLGLTWRETLLAYNRGPTAYKDYDPYQHHYPVWIAEQVSDGKVRYFIDNQIESH